MKLIIKANAQIIIFIISLLFISGCIFTSGFYEKGWYTKIIKKELPKKNPTSYVFNANIKRVSEFLRNMELPPKYFNPDTVPEISVGLFLGDSSDVTYEYGKRNHSYYYETKDPLDVYPNPHGIYDIYYRCYDPICISRFYFSEKGNPLQYLAEFHMHLVAIDSTKTEVTVYTFMSQVINGLTDGAFEVHGPHNIYTYVEPTTIEEYQILLMLGKYIKEKNMPELILPE